MITDHGEVMRFWRNRLAFKRYAVFFEWSILSYHWTKDAARKAAEKEGLDKHFVIKLGHGEAFE